MYSNYEKLIKSIDYLIEVNTKNINIEKEFAIERAFANIGGILREWENKKIIVKNSHVLIQAAIEMRNKISHFYHGLNFTMINEAIKDLPELKRIILKLNIK